LPLTTHGSAQHPSGLAANCEAGYAIRGSESKISRLELGKNSFKPRDVSAELQVAARPPSAAQFVLFGIE
jgi:hypothetical protein